MGYKSVARRAVGLIAVGALGLSGLYQIKAEAIPAAIATASILMRIMREYFIIVLWDCTLRRLAHLRP